LKEIGEQIGLKGTELKDFIREQQTLEREEREKQREQQEKQRVYEREKEVQQEKQTEHEGEREGSTPSRAKGYRKRT